MPPIGGGLARARVKNHRLIESWHRRAKTAQAALSGWFKCHSSGSSSLQAERNCLSIAEISTTTRLSSYHHLDNLLHHLCCDHCLCLVLFFFLAKPTDAIIKASSQAGNPWWWCWWGWWGWCWCWWWWWWWKMILFVWYKIPQMVYNRCASCCLCKFQVLELLYTI